MPATVLYRDAASCATQARMDFVAFTHTLDDDMSAFFPPDGAEATHAWGSHHDNAHRSSAHFTIDGLDTDEGYDTVRNLHALDFELYRGAAALRRRALARAPLRFEPTELSGPQWRVVEPGRPRGAAPLRCLAPQWIGRPDVATMEELVGS